MPDLIDIPGMSRLWEQTQGDPSIRIAIIDGAADLERACFRGAALTMVEPYWQETPSASGDMQYIDEFYQIIEENDEQVDEYVADGMSMDEARAKQRAEIDKRVPHDVMERLASRFHASHICSTIFGQPGSPVEGIAPRCTGFNIAVYGDENELMSSVGLARAFNLAIDLGAHIVHSSIVIPTQTGRGHELYERAVQQCIKRDILVVSPVGNDEGTCMVLPACLPGALAVGAMSDDGQPLKFSNWTGTYQTQGILAPGQNILGAKPGSDEPIRKQGTSCATPVMTGVAALMMSLQKQRGRAPSGRAVRSAILNSARPCTSAEVGEPERCLRGRLDISATINALDLGPSTSRAPSRSTRVTSLPATTPSSPLMAKTHVYPSSRPAEISMSTNPHMELSASHHPDAPDFHGPSDRVYAIGTLGYDFGSEARRDSFKQLMPAASFDGTKIPANPYDARQIVDYLAHYPSEGKSLIWTLNLELTPIYAIEPIGPFAADVYDVLQQLLSGQVQAEHDEAYIERVSIPARASDRTATLFSGQIVPVLEVDATRGVYGWRVNTLVEGAIEAVRSRNEQADDEAMRKTLGGFLQRIYYDLRNHGRTSRDRALNFAATNAFQAASTFSDAVSIGMELDSISVEKSPFCRLDSDCWDVKLKFFDPENGRRARRVFRFTIDVSDTIPVTLGEVRTWATPS